MEKVIENMSLEELKTYEAELNSVVPRNVDELEWVQDQIKQLEAKAEQEAAQMVRIQAQEEKVESITLPDNFNDIFGDPLANDIIIEVIKDFQRQANAEHNAEVENLVATYKEEIQAGQERELQLKRQNDELQKTLDAETKQAQADAAEHSNMLQQIAQLQLDKQDAESKRDAAVRDKEAAEALLAEKQAHIDTLRAEIALGAKSAINVTNINPSDRLAALVEQSKNAKIKSAAEIALENAAPFRGKVLVDGVVAPPIALEVPTFPNQADHTSHQLDQTGASPIPADHQEVAQTATFQVQSGNGMDHEAPSADGQSTETVSRTEFEALKGRVINLEDELNFRRRSA